MWRCMVLCGAVVVCGGGASAQSLTASASSGAFSLVIDDVAVVDVRDGRLLQKQTVVIEGNRVRAVGNMRNIKRPQGAQIVDGSGKYLIPGLWDMHVHIWSDWPLYSWYVAHGITGIREMSQQLPVTMDTIRVRRQEIAHGERVGPRTITTTNDFAGEGPLTPDQARRRVDSLHAAGVDFVKLHTVYDRAIYFAVTTEARRVGIPVVGHLGRYNEPAVTDIEASDSGLRSIEHIEEIGCWQAPPATRIYLATPLPDAVADTNCRAVAAHFLRNGTWLVPTLGIRHTLSPGSKLDETQQHAVRVLHRAGIPILAGSDATPTPGLGARSALSLHGELALFVDAGMTPLEALRTATLNPARYMDATDSLGTIAPGKLADLVLLDADPLTDIHNTTKIRAVIANGRYFDRSTLDTLLADVRATRPESNSP